MEKSLKPTVRILATVPFIMVLDVPYLCRFFRPSGGKPPGQPLPNRLLDHGFSIPAGIVIPFAKGSSQIIGEKKIMVPALLVYGAGGSWPGLAAIFAKEAAYPYLLEAPDHQGIRAGRTYQLAAAWPTTSSGKEQIQVLESAESRKRLWEDIVSWLAGAMIAPDFLVCPVLCLRDL